VLDTADAAPFTVLIGRAAAATSSVQLDAAPGATAVLPGVGNVSIQSGTLKSFRLGEVSLTDADVGVTDAPDHMSQVLGRPIDAVVGWNFLRTRTIRINYPDHQVDLTAARGPLRSAVPFEVTPKRHVITVKMDVNGKGPFIFVVDTGATGTLISTEAAERAGVTSGDANTAPKAINGAAVHATRGSSSTLTLGGMAHGAVSPVIVDYLPNISAVAGAPIDGILGADILSRGSLTIDFPHSLLWLDDQEPR
jgi:predicted aspartyl protease